MFKFNYLLNYGQLQIIVKYFLMYHFKKKYSQIFHLRPVSDLG